MSTARKQYETVEEALMAVLDVTKVSQTQFRTENGRNISRRMVLFEDGSTFSIHISEAKTS